jgi:hypothetical protein
MFKTCKFLLMAICVLSCRPRSQPPQSEVRDIVTVDGNFKTILYFIEDDGKSARLIRKFCGYLDTKSFKAEQLEGRNLRDSCKTLQFETEFQNFMVPWQSEFLNLTKQNQVSKFDLEMREIIIAELKKVDTNGSGQAVLFQPNLDHPPVRQTYAYWMQALEKLTEPKTENHEADLPRPLPSDDSDLLFGGNLRDAGREASYPINIQVNIPAKLNAISIEAKSLEEKPCYLAIAGATMILPRTNNHPNGGQFRLTSELTAPNSFRLPNLTADMAVDLRLQSINFARQPINCRFEVRRAPDLSMSVARFDARDQAMRQMMSARPHRLAHYMWHSARNSYRSPNATDAERGRIDAMKWKPPRPIIYRPNGSMDLEETAKTGAGEDFLFMHRQMLQILRSGLESRGMRMYESWKRIPLPNEGFRTIAQEVTDQLEAGFQRIQSWESQFSDENIGRFKNLSELGIQLEFTIHNSLHSRWSASQSSMRQVIDDPVTRTNRSRSGWDWDDDDYDHLSDSYSAHVNPLFWRIHGWVDDRINAWLKARGLDVVSLDCSAEKARCVQWQGTWVGPEHTQNLLKVIPASSSKEDLESTLKLLSENSFMSVVR